MHLTVLMDITTYPCHDRNDGLHIFLTKLYVTQALDKVIDK